MTTPYLTEDSQTILTEDGVDTLILEQDPAAAGGGTRRRDMAAIINSKRKRKQK